MKKITLLLTLLTFGAQAQTFPLPYCEITDANGVTVEEITSVDFAGISISNSDAASVLVDETTTIVNVPQDETYTIEVAGNTYGNFDTDIVAFIDWNQNDLLDDTGEIYQIGTLTNTNGSDGNSVTLDIIIPTDAVLGTTRIRLTKTYQDPDSPAEINPCGIQFNPFGQGVFSGFGQALDFSLDVEAPLGIDTYEFNAFSVYPIPTKDVLNITSKSVLNAVKIYNILGQEVYAKNTEASQLKLDLSSFTSGIYIVKLFTEEGQHSFRVIKE
ncbi:T9SS type A sorting domain-containing protein [Psychroserpens jangbogonensis]|uniref:T9SS type A sorting domain-containing protein n=1 Tax=Psychroserpens jangbogonensis TaxID=1484460 RepID=UPI00053D1321|nr:T9SS type A sorting domain-containing protein [Psychroserpens jangbogonensis]